VSYCLQEMGDRIEGQLSRGLKMAGNAVGEMRMLVANARSSLDAVRAGRTQDPLAARTVPEDPD